MTKKLSLIQKLTHISKRCLVFMVCWFMASLMVFLLVKPDKNTINAGQMFLVCATKLKDDGERHFAKAGQMAYYDLKDIKQRPDDFRLCHESAELIFDDFHVMTLSVNDGVYHLATLNDSLGDPLEYWYQVEQNTVKPLAWRHGLNNARFLALLMGLFLAVVLYKLVRWWSKQKSKQ